MLQSIAFRSLSKCIAKVHVRPCPCRTKNTMLRFCIIDPSGVIDRLRRRNKWPIKRSLLFRIGWLNGRRPNFVQVYSFVMSFCQSMTSIELVWRRRIEGRDSKAAHWRKSNVKICYVVDRPERKPQQLAIPRWLSRKSEYTPGNGYNNRLLPLRWHVAFWFDHLRRLINGITNVVFEHFDP